MVGLSVLGALHRRHVGDYPGSHDRGCFIGGSATSFMVLMVVYGVIQMLEGYVLVPKMFSEAVNLHPIAIIAAVLIFVGLMGLLGRVLCHSAGDTVQSSALCLSARA